ncbi:phospholipid scramblase 1 isoform X1 [Ictalurus furcatus]|uniref:phospholipid scramblase 1 isoform X1 n=1 Tax=Ictalurus furcatus TaxID=66913 RepID=UPI00235005D6|nr:phospholipid scramblase 1 isoform X1 [Ictalurus furcatus]
MASKLFFLWADLWNCEMSLCFNTIGVPLNLIWQVHCCFRCLASMRKALIVVPGPFMSVLTSPMALVGFESNNKYEIKNSMGQNVFYAVEENDCLTRQCCGPLRSFTIRVLDNFGQEVITISRPLKCMSCCFPCCLQELEVQSPPGNIVGYVLQEWHPFFPKFTIQNEHKEPVLKLRGPFCGWSCLPDVDFEILTMDEVSIGRISKQWSGLLREVFTDTDNFGIQFPMDLDVRMKAVMIGLCFLVDFMFFETNN